MLSAGSRRRRSTRFPAGAVGRLSPDKTRLTSKAKKFRVAANGVIDGTGRTNRMARSPPAARGEVRTAPSPGLGEAEALLLELASVFGASNGADDLQLRHPREAHASNLEAKYRALLEQIPAVVFMAYLDRGVSEAYVSPEIEAALGYSREEWLEDPVRWYAASIPTTSSAGALRRRACSSPASRCAPRTA